MNSKMLVSILTVSMLLFQLPFSANAANESASSRSSGEVTNAAQASQPLTISGGRLAAGSYYLTGDWYLAEGELIVENGAEVTLDLNGYTLLANGEAGMRAMTNSGTLTIVDSSDAATGAITGGCTEDSGGAIFSTGCLIIHGGTISRNYAEGNGGAIALSSGELYMDGGVIAENTAGGSGGGICAADSVVWLGGGSVRNNTAAVDGGAVALIGSSDGARLILNSQGDSEALSIADNVADNNGGGVYVLGAELELGAVTITENTAGYNGGGICIDGGAGADLDHSADTEGESLITGNVAISGDGGGIYASCGMVRLEGLDVSGNTAGYNGGGLAIVGQDEAPVEISMEDAQIGGEAAQGNAAVKGNGGGIYVYNGNVQLLGGEVSGNKALNWAQLSDLDHGNGGGIYLCGGSLEVSSGTVKSNSCSRYGGGIYVYGVDDGDSVSLTGGSIEDNIAAQQGGAVAVCNTQLEISGEAEISGNKAASGGGLSLLDGVKAQIKGGSITDNQAVDLNSATEDIFRQLKNSFDCDSGNGGAIAIPENPAKASSTTEAIISGQAVISGNSSAEGDELYAAGGKLTVLTETEQDIA